MKVCENTFGADAMPESHVSGPCDRVVVWGPLIQRHSTVSPTFTVTLAGENVNDPPGPTCTVFVVASARLAPSTIMTAPRRRDEQHRRETCEADIGSSLFS